MNIYNFNDKSFKKTNIYQDFIKDNNSFGYLKIRAYSANEAIPIKGLQITITKTINSDTIVFFEGKTNESGIIEKIILPAPKQNQTNLVAPLKATYDIISYYPLENLKQIYQADIYDGIYVVQNINIIPQKSIGDINGY